MGVDEATMRQAIADLVAQLKTPLR
jgi:hypothetical protein